MTGTKLEAALRHTFGEVERNGQCVMEFIETEDGGWEARDITNHVNKLEEIVNE